MKAQIAAMTPPPSSASATANSTSADAYENDSFGEASYEMDHRDVGEAGSVADLKVPPHSIEAEQAVLGALMLDDLAWESIADRLTDEDFYRRDHRLIFGAIRGLADKGQPRDAVTVAEWLEKHDDDEAAGGLAYVGTLAKETASAANVKAYADIVRERSILRSLIHVGTEIAGAGFNPAGRDSRELLEKAEQMVFAIAEQSQKTKEGFSSLSDLAALTLQQIDDLYNSDGSITGVPTGLHKLDELTSGLQKGDLIICAGRPAMGKTTLALNIAERAALQHKLPTAVFSMEMPSSQLVMRMISSLARINQKKVRTGDLSQEDWSRITSTVTIMSDAPMYIDDSAALSPTEIRARARRLKREAGGLGLIVIDYLQLMQVPGKNENRATEISEISRSLKALAKELDVPVVALSQLSRKPEERPNKRPINSDLRESGSIEQDADVIMFIYRDEVYNEDSPDKGIAEIIIGKQRNGPIGTVKATFLGEFTRFENYSPETF